MNDDYLDTMLEILKMKYGDSYKDVYGWGKDVPYEEEEEDFHVSKGNKKHSYETMLNNVMEYLESVGGVEFAIMKDPDLGKWWSEKVRVREAKRKRKDALEKLRSTMSEEELNILGINVK